jgi:hypothetical protein
MYLLSICNPWDRNIHGYIPGTYHPQGHYINEMTITSDEFIQENESICSDCLEHRPNCEIHICQIYEHNGYSLSLPKTSYLSIFQRKWKKYYYKKLQFYKNIRNLQYRQIHGKFKRFN